MCPSVCIKVALLFEVFNCWFNIVLHIHYWLTIVYFTVIGSPLFWLTIINSTLDFGKVHPLVHPTATVCFHCQALKLAHPLLVHLLNELLTTLVTLVNEYHVVHTC